MRRRDAVISPDVRRRLRAQLWQPPRPHGEIERDRVVGPLELFYDLVVVVLVAQAAHRLTVNLAARGVAEFVVVFTVIWIAWLNGTLLHDLHGREDVRGRNSFLVQILLLVPLGADIPGAGGPRGRAFAVTAALLFLVVAFLWWRVSRVDAPVFARATRLYVSITLALAAGFAASAPLTADARLGCWAVLAALYLASVAVVYTRMPAQPGQAVVITDALNERFGLLVIIVLGEAVTGVVSGLTADPTAARHLAVATVCTLVGFGAWWTYFDFVARRPPRSTRPAVFVWQLGHLPISAAIAGLGATMPRLIEDAADGHTATTPAWVLCTSAAVVLLATVAVMSTLTAWQTAAPLLRPVASANLVAAAVAIGLAVLRPAPLVLCILLALTFGGPWIFAVLRKAGLEAKVGR